MGGFLLKVKTKQGQHIVSTLSENETIANLKSQISELTQIPVDGLSVLIGFPPKPLDLSNNGNSLSATGITNGDTLIVEEKPYNTTVPQEPQAQQQQEQPAVNQHQIDEDSLLAQRLAAEEENPQNCQGILLKQVVPSDNSCLFTSIGELNWDNCWTQPKTSSGSELNSHFRLRGQWQNRHRMC